MSPTSSAGGGLAEIAALLGGGSPRLRLLCTMFVFTGWLLDGGQSPLTAVLITAVIGLVGCVLSERMFPAAHGSAPGRGLLDFTVGVRL